ncbi:MAG TPA: hypothetical protein VN666_16645 [Nitrospira sp.]|nr:hypothetical protein [Nitrospira sp.]
MSRLTALRSKAEGKTFDSAPKTGARKTLLHKHEMRQNIRSMLHDYGKISVAGSDVYHHDQAAQVGVQLDDEGRKNLGLLPVIASPPRIAK